MIIYDKYFDVEVYDCITIMDIGHKEVNWLVLEERGGDKVKVLKVRNTEDLFEKGKGDNAKDYSAEWDYLMIVDLDEIDFDLYEMIVNEELIDCLGMGKRDSIRARILYEPIVYSPFLFRSKIEEFRGFPEDELYELDYSKDFKMIDFHNTIVVYRRDPIEIYIVEGEVEGTKYIKFGIGESNYVENSDFSLYFEIDKMEKIVDKEEEKEWEVKTKKGLEFRIIFNKSKLYNGIFLESVKKRKSVWDIG